MARLGLQKLSLQSHPSLFLSMSICYFVLDSSTNLVICYGQVSLFNELIWNFKSAPWKYYFYLSFMWNDCYMILFWLSFVSSHQLFCFILQLCINVYALPDVSEICSSSPQLQHAQQGHAVKCIDFTLVIYYVLETNFGFCILLVIPSAILLDYIVIDCTLHAPPSACLISLIYEVFVMFHFLQRNSSDMCSERLRGG
jgi:hypothetical protein